MRQAPALHKGAKWQYTVRMSNMTELKWSSQKKGDWKTSKDNKKNDAIGSLGKTFHKSRFD
jgi:hypothetical protein